MQSLAKIATALEKNKGDFKITINDIKKIEKLNAAINRHIKQEPWSNKNKTLGFNELFIITEVHEGLTKIFKLKKGHLVNNYKERFLQIKALMIHCDPIERIYPDEIYKRMAIPPIDLNKVMISDKMQLDSPSKFADYSLSKLYKVSSKTVERYRVKYTKKRLSFFEAYKKHFSIIPGISYAPWIEDISKKIKPK